MKVRTIAALAAATAFCAAAFAQSPAPQYGPNVTLEQAKKLAAAGEVEARKNGWTMAISIVDTAGQLVYFQRMDDTQTASVDIASDKAVTAAMFKRPTKALQDAIAGGGAGLRLLTARRVTALEGGLPIYVGGKIAGGIGVSGGSSEEDGLVAKAGLQGLAK